MPCRVSSTACRSDPRYIEGLSISPDQQTNRMRTLNIWDEESLNFERQPDLFVNREADPIVWTVRGIRHFSPRFRAVGVAIHSVQTRAELEVALRRWHHRERLLLENKVRTLSRSDGHPIDAHRCLVAIMDQDPAADDLITSLERRCGINQSVTP